MAGRLKRGWSLLTAVWGVMDERQLGLIAAGVAFFAMFAVFPALAALIALVGLWADPVVVQDTLALLEDFVPPEAHAILTDQTARLIGSTPQTLGWASGGALLAAAWSARRGVGALAQGLNAIYGGRPRGGLLDMALALLLTVVLIAVGVTAIAAILFTPLALALLAPLLPPGSSVPLIAEVARWVVAVSALLTGLGLFYRYGPNRPDRRRSRFLSPGLWLAMAVWGGASVGFTVFLANFGNYNEVYGSIGAAIALLMWFYISAYAVLIGAALNHALEHAPEPAIPASQPKVG